MDELRLLVVGLLALGVGLWAALGLLAATPGAVPVSGVIARSVSSAAGAAASEDGTGGLVVSGFRYLQVIPIQQDPWVEIDTADFSWDSDNLTWTFDVAPLANATPPADGWVNITDRRCGGSVSGVLAETDLGQSRLNASACSVALRSSLNATRSFTIHANYSSLDGIDLQVKAGNGSAIAAVVSSTRLNISNGFYTASFNNGFPNCTEFALKNLKNSTGYDILDPVGSGNGGPDWRGGGGQHSIGTYGGLCSSIGNRTTTLAINSSLLVLAAVSGASANAGQLNMSFMSQYPFWLADFAGDGTWTDAQLIQFQGGIAIGSLYGSGWAGNATMLNADQLKGSGPFLSTPAGYCIYKQGQNSSLNQPFLVSTNNTPTKCQWLLSDGAAVNDSGATFLMNAGSWGAKDVSAGVANWTQGLCDAGTGWSTCLAIHNLTRTNVPATFCDVGSISRRNSQLFAINPNATGVFRCWVNNSVAIPESYRDWKYLILANSSAYANDNLFLYNGSDQPTQWATLNFTAGTVSSNSSRADLGNRSLGFWVAAFEQTGNQNQYYRGEIGQLNPAPPQAATETEALLALRLGVNQSAIAGAAMHEYQQVLTVNASGAQANATFDLVAEAGNQTWAFNYNTTGELFANLSNISSSFIVWENSNLTSASITANVADYINHTKG